MQKIWFWIFGAMFVVPEILWSPLVNLIYDIFQNSNNVKTLRPNFLTNPNNIYILLYIIFFQFIGVLGTTIITIKSKLNLIPKIFLVATMTILLLVNGFILYLVFALRNGIGF